MGPAGELVICSQSWLGPIGEDKVLKNGLRALREAIRSGESLGQFPQRKGGGALMSRQGFFQFLLEGGGLCDKHTMDVTAAQNEIKFLTLEQLLEIRSRHLDFAGARADAAKASFLATVDRWALELLAERILGPGMETKDCQRAMLARRVMMIYGAQKEIADAAGTAWWLLSHEPRRYIDLKNCKMSLESPGTAYCFRSHSAPDHHSTSRIFRWQLLLVENPECWIEDPFATERAAPSVQRVGSDRSKEASTKPPPNTALFAGFDVDFDEIIKELDMQKFDARFGNINKGGTCDGTEDIDEFLDGLLEDSLFKDPSVKETNHADEVEPKEVEAPALAQDSDHEEVNDADAGGRTSPHEQPEINDALVVAAEDNQSQPPKENIWTPRGHDFDSKETQWVDCCPKVLARAWSQVDWAYFGS
eukprot:gnl/MRDRNA2_/MRDRNA2_105879_c0_seq1.p1 gnl/MRDRNA2_/MRDRNA2_105879_c0~~gnl/MRDRNA2_/MRDRNA2_105879_c0_seq1.p1  ORF type:complete len:439 (-),score=94.18 gnl/MRDRNA2_/MRDRNA2_105879_c0_seq1:124-1380(-)